MHWNCVTVLFSGMGRNGENILLFEGNTMVSKDKNSLFRGLNFLLDIFSPGKAGKMASGYLFLVLYFPKAMYHIPLYT